MADALGYCHDCKRRWSGLAEAHCAACCQHFTSDSAFDMHQRLTKTGSKCLPPSAVGLVIKKRTSGDLWGRPGPDSASLQRRRGPQTDADAELASGPRS
jgi:hypothetical protein